MKSFTIKNAFIAISLMYLSSMAYAKNSQDWTGFYAGPEIGVVFNDAHLHSQHIGLTSPSGTCDSNSNFSSFSPGLQLGYAREFNSRIVLGIEGNYSYDTTQNRKLECPCPINSNVSDRFSFKNRMQGSIRGRIGYALDHHLLPFFMIGGSLTNVGLTYDNEGGDHYSKNSTKAGWLAGIGLEWLFSNSWSVRGEYFYADYNHLEMNIPTIYGLSDPNGMARANLRNNNVFITLNYWFLD